MKSAILRPKRMAEESPRTSQRFVSPKVGDPRIADVCGKPLLKPPTKGGFLPRPPQTFRPLISIITQPQHFVKRKIEKK